MNKLKTSLIIFLMICLNGFPVFAAGQKIMSIQVKKGEIRSTPSFLGIIVARVSYGDRVNVRESVCKKIATKAGFTLRSSHLRRLYSIPELKMCRNQPPVTNWPLPERDSANRLKTNLRKTIQTSIMHGSTGWKNLSFLRNGSSSF